MGIVFAQTARQAGEQCEMPRAGQDSGHLRTEVAESANWDGT